MRNATPELKNLPAKADLLVYEVYLDLFANIVSLFTDIVGFFSDLIELLSGGDE